MSDPDPICPRTPIVHNLESAGRIRIFKEIWRQNARKGGCISAENCCYLPVKPMAR